MAKLVTGTPGGNRSILAEMIPLDTPFLIQFFPVYACNLECEYCIHSLPPSQQGNISDMKIMPFDFYKKCIEDISLFPSKIRMLRFAGIGEPLLHRDIAKMVKYADSRGVAERVDIVTNGLFLTKSISDELIASGLTTLRISVNGLSDCEYNKNTKKKIDFDQFVRNIEYFFCNKTNTKLYIKIIDYMVPNENMRQKFVDLFEPISDNVAIEHLTPTVQQIPISNISDKFEKTQGGTELIDAKVCPQPFYMIQINPDGKIVPCCSMEYPLVLGDGNYESIKDIWNSSVMRSFQLRMLSGAHSANLVCSHCSLYKFGLYPEDALDLDSIRLKRIFQDNT